MVRVTGGGAPAELWRAYMTAALPRLHAQPIPPGPPAPLPPPLPTPPPVDANPPVPAPTPAPVIPTMR
jgi:penicillin-binding protein 1A